MAQEDCPLPPLPREGRLAGIDFGTVRIGIAITDPLQLIASPVENYVRQGEALDAQWFRDLVAEESIVGFVVGLPLHLSGDESEKSLQARKFGAWLSDETDRPFVLHDERHTSADAQAHMLAAKMTRKRRKARMDMVAAQIILKAFLDARARS